MSSTPRLNAIIGALEAGQHSFSLFAPAEIETAIELQSCAYDGVVFEGEHRAWDAKSLRDALQYLLNRGQILKSGTAAPALTPTVRIPANGVEQNQFFAKQALDLGCYGVVWPHVSTVEEAYNAVAACRYPRMKDKPLYEPAGIRGDGPAQAARYWGISQQEYYQRADVWPLAPEGELLVVIQIEDLAGVANLSDMLANVPGIGAVLIGEGDLSQELGCARQYEHKDLLDAMAQIVANLLQQRQTAYRSTCQDQLWLPNSHGAGRLRVWSARRYSVVIVDNVLPQSGENGRDDGQNQAAQPC